MTTKQSSEGTKVPIDADAIRAWVGEQTYNPDMERRDSMLFGFLLLVRRAYFIAHPSDRDVFAWQIIKNASDAEVEALYAQFLMTG